jgi:hypothetical protein
MAELEKQGVHLYIEFMPDGGVTIGLGADKPEMLEALKAIAKMQNQQISWNMKYKLLLGDAVEIYDMPKDMQTGGGGLFGSKDKARVNVKITGENMALLDEQGTTTLTKMK